MDEVGTGNHGETKVSRRRLERIETILETLSKGPGREECSRNPNVVPHIEVVRQDFAIQTTLSGAVNLDVLSKTLYSLLPSREQAYSLCTTEKFIPRFFQQLLIRNYRTLSSTGETALTGADVAQLPPQSAHPVLIAQKLLLYARVMQYHHSASENPEWRVRASQMASAAIDLVTTKDALVTNAEGLECLMMEATYHINNCDLRRAFSAVRRAISTAQLIGVHLPVHCEYQRLDTSAPAFDPTYMWCRILYADRTLCLVLGLPQGSIDVSFAEPLATDGLGAEEILERTHCAIASRILERNERDASEEIATTYSIDASIQAATSIPSLPSLWWSTPSFLQISSQDDMFLASNRTISQILHYNLVNQTHLNFLFTLSTKSSHMAAYEYSRSASTTASREILHRYLALQGSSLLSNACDLVDFFALIAAITLLLLHLETHWSFSSQKPSALSHMRASDRAMILQAMPSMVKATPCNAPKILTELLAVEEEAYVLRSVGSGKIVKHDPDSRPYYEVQIPCFGSLRVSSVRICFKRAFEIEQLTSSVKMLPITECHSTEGDEIGNRTSAQEWVLSEFGTSFGVDAYDGAENAFLNGFQDFLDVTMP
jgi:hypothetical protein